MPKQTHSAMRRPHLTIMPGEEMLVINVLPVREILAATLLVEALAMGRQIAPTAGQEAA